MRNLLLTICLLFSLHGIAQQATISGIVKDSAGTIAVANVALLHAGDSSWVKSGLTDDSGEFTLSGVPAGEYLMSVSVPGYKSALQPVTVTDGQQEPLTIVLQRDGTSLKAVTVTSKKPFIQMDLGKMVVNVDESPSSAGLNVLELLRKMPAVTVDNNGNISMQGKQGALVLIDDQPTYLSAEQLAEYLKSIPSDEVAQIELITQPSAKYDAAGNAGIINIKRKKIKKSGWNGTGTATVGQGVFPFALGSALVNYRKNKLNVMLSADEHKATGFADWQEYQLLSDPQSGSATSVTNIHSGSIEHFSIANARLAADYDITDKQTIGASVKVGYHTNSFVDNVQSSTYDEATNVTSYNTIVSPDGFIRKDLTADAYYAYKLSNDHSLNINLDYIAYNNSPYQDITNTAYDAQMQPLPGPLLLHSHQPTLINIYSIKGDYADTLKNGMKLETGFKSSLVTTVNNAEFSVYQNGTWMNDTTRSNRFVYKENINALYISASKKLSDKWEARAGLRAENTNAQGIPQAHEQEFNRSYISLFPTAFVSYKLNKDNQFELNYGRRIDRPTYQSLNPFINYSFQYNYNVGNPYLQPQYTNSIELKHSFKNMLITTASFTNTNGVINDVLIANSSKGVVYNTKANTGTNNAVNLSVVFNKDLFKWWSVNAYAVGFYAHYKGMVDGYNMVTTGPGFFTGISNQFSFVKGWKAECGVYYSGNYLESIIATSLPSIYMSFGVSEKLSAVSILKLAIEDPFYLNRFKEQNSLLGLYTNAVFRYSTRSVALAYTYAFGKSTAAQKEIDATDESKRIK